MTETIFYRDATPLSSRQKLNLWKKVLSFSFNDDVARTENEHKYGLRACSIFHFGFQTAAGWILTSPWVAIPLTLGGAMALISYDEHNRVMDTNTSAAWCRDIIVTLVAGFASLALYQGSVDDMKRHFREQAIGVCWDQKEIKLDGELSKYPVNLKDIITVTNASAQNRAAKSMQKAFMTTAIPYGVEDFAAGWYKGNSLNKRFFTPFTFETELRPADWKPRSGNVCGPSPF